MVEAASVGGRVYLKGKSDRSQLEGGLREGRRGGEICVPSRGGVRGCVGTEEGDVVRDARPRPTARVWAAGGGRAGCRDYVLGETGDVLR